MLKTLDITICTTNQGKVAEFQEIFDNLMQVNADLALGLKKWNFSRDSFKTLAYRGIHDFEVDETEDTYLGNAALKAIAGAKAVQGLALADDSGIEVFALNKAPGIYSGRYLRDPNKGINALLNEMQAHNDRRVRYVCALVLAEPSGKILFQTQQYWYGELAYEKHGEQGFGFDPVVYPCLDIALGNDLADESFITDYSIDKSRTVAELSSKEKNSYSHRFKAVREFLSFLNDSYKVI
ncbi:MAG: non-canonical purine NTP pyrophosphatase [Cyanobacteria bacterium REEB446]|nr:non-canonical purine NTP pyrophosphatase [Cyanobacteria bacterium REEB446]